MKEHLEIFEQRILLFSVFVVALCGIVYELVLGSLATYLLGNPVQQYSITIGFFMSSMGLGSYLSQFIQRDLLRNFVRIEVFLGLFGGSSVILLNYLFSFSTSFYLLHIFFLVVIGTLVGLEIPLLTRILRRYGSLKEILSNVLSLDYMGGLAGSLLFPLLLFPLLGRVLTCVVVGLANIVIAFYIIVRIDYPQKRRGDYLMPLLFMALLGVMAWQSEEITHFMERRMYADDVVFSQRSEFQEIVLTRSGNDFRLYLDGALQFATVDEYRYHEMLVYPALNLCNKENMKVLVLGGGDGLAVRTALNYRNVGQVTLVELDPMMIDLATNNSSFRHINEDSLHDSRVKVVVGDAYEYLRKNRIPYDVIIGDFPDPHDEVIAKLYTVQFFSLLKRSLGEEGIFVTQSTSPLFAQRAFWCINKTLKQAFPTVEGYHLFIPTFGDWGFNVTAKTSRNLKKLFPVKVGDFHKKPHIFTEETYKATGHFPADMEEVPVEVNTFNKPVLYSYYLEAWKKVDY